MNFEAKFWLKFSLVNLLIVASLGVILRYKIGFNFPYLDQRNMHHAHSHFAFVGWLTHTIFVLIISFIYHYGSNYYSGYKSILIANLICAYGLLFSFFFFGDGILSSVFMGLSFLVSLVFTYFTFQDFNKFEKVHPGIAWFKSALFLNLISYAGIIYEIKLLFFGGFNEKIYLASNYFYLHFQYNGFFIFSCMGLAITKALRLLPEFKYDKLIFKLFFATLLPAYFLSTLWANLPVWLYALVVIAAIVQILIWFKFIADIRKALPSAIHITPTIKYFFLIVAIAFTIKISLQLASTIPIISKLAFGFRHIVIAYLHLVLLAIVSGFLLSYLYVLKLIHNNKSSIIALCIFLVGIYLNEIVLAVQGIASFSYIAIANVNEILFGIALILFLGAIALAYTSSQKTELMDE